MEDAEQPPTPPLKGTNTENIWFGAIAGAAAAGALGYLGVIISDGRSLYSTWLFCFIPLLAGFLGSLSLYRCSQAPTYAQAAYLGLNIYVIIGLVMMLTGFEGLACLIMAAPLALPMLIAGSCFANYILNTKRSGNQVGPIACVVPLVPLAAVYSMCSIPDAAIKSESTTILVHAPATTIWPLLLNLDSVPDPSWLPFRMGIAHPTSAHSAGSSVGAARQCTLSTGVMNEKISALELDRLLRFEVLNTPPSMKEFNPFFEVRSAHLSGYYHCRFGEFRLQPLSNGWTRVTGTSEYDYSLYPAPYWGLWTDSIVEHVHLLVMDEIKRRAESKK